MKSRALLAVLGVVLSARAATGATHTWTGAVSPFWSNIGNWTGGTPAGDPDADLVFPASGFSNPTSTNDIPALTVNSIKFETTGFTIGGAPGSSLTVKSAILPPTDGSTGTNTISLPLEVATTAFVTVNTGTLVLSGPISGGELNVSGQPSGTVVLTGSSANSLLHLAGFASVFVNGSQPLTPAQVNGGILGGTGTIGPLTAVDLGYVQPGTAATGILTAQGDSTLGCNSTFRSRLTGPTAAAGYDRLAIAGTLTIQPPTGRICQGVRLELSPAGPVSLGETFTILQTTGSLTGTFASIPDGTIVTAVCQNFRVNYTANAVVATRVAGATPIAVATGATTMCPGGTPAALTGSGGETCSWTPALGLDDPNSCSPLASPMTTTTYSLTVTGPPDCSSSNLAQITVTVDPSCGPSPAEFFTVSPCRVADTRGGSPLAADSVRVFSVAGQCGIPVGARQVALNVTAVLPTSDGFLTLYADGTPRPARPTLNYRQSQIRANNAIVPLSPAGDLAVYCGGSAVDVLVDVVGYYQ